MTESKEVNTVRMLDMSENDRPREKMLKYGAQALSDVELLAVIVNVGIKGKNALMIAQSILDFHHNQVPLQEVICQELCDIPGVGISVSSKIVAMLELSKRFNRRENFQKVQLTNPASIAAVFIEELKNETKEHFIVLVLDTKNRVICEDWVSTGSLNASIVHPREVFKTAIKRSANSIALVHNHPSGDPQPSLEDVETTKRLDRAGELLGIRVIDHIVIGRDVYLSMKQENYF